MAPSADTLIVGADVRTLDPDHPRAAAVAISDGLIVALDDAALELRDGRTEVIDLAGATLTPGLVDGHMHPLMGAEGFIGLDLSDCRDVDDLRERVAKAAADVGRGDWVRGFALDHNVFAGRPIDRSALDDVVPDIPTALTLYDGHSMLVNSAALRLAGIEGPREFGLRSEVVCDADGAPTGHLLEIGAMSLLDPVLPVMPLTERRERALAVLSSMAATGLTGGHVMDGADASYDLLADLESHGDLPIRLRLAGWCGADADLDALVDATRRTGRRWGVRAVKLFIDGTVEGGTAWLDHADCYGQSTESLWVDPEEYGRAVRHFAAAGVPTATHAIGDAGVRHVIDTLEPLAAGGVRHRIEHIETLPLDQVHRMARAGIIASMQPSHAAYTKADHSDEWSTRLGTERADRAWRTADMRAAGVTLVLGSDWPIAEYDARRVLAFAQLRRHAGTDTAPVQPAQALTATQALEGMTTQAAVAAQDEAAGGRVAPGYRADLTAFTVDPLDAPPDELADAPIRLTMVDGAVVHRA